MTVAGYNVIPDVNDHEPVVGVNYSEGEHTATLFIGNTNGDEDITMSRDEMCALRGLLLIAIRHIDELEATYLYASISGAGKTHLMLKEGNSKTGKVLCGQEPKKWVWSLDLVIGEPGGMNVCQRCQAVYQKQQQKEQ